MAGLLTDFRNILIEKTVSNETIVRLLRNVDDKSPIVIPDKGLIYQNVFPYPFIPPTQDSAERLITFRVISPSVDRKNNLLRDIRVFVNVLSSTSPDAMRATDYSGDIDPDTGLYPSALSIDLLAEEFDRMLHESVDFGLQKMQFIKQDDFYPAPNYYGLTLQYKAYGWNMRDKCVVSE